MNASLVVVDDGGCGYVPAAGTRCRRRGTQSVAGIVPLLCKQHARIVATEPGSSGIVRAAPQGAVEIVRDLEQATTFADVERCRKAIALQIHVCAHPRTGLKPEIIDALHHARARVRKNGGLVR